MPGGDRTGPRGFGPRTGRGAGYCAGYDRPGYSNPGPGYGMGYGGRFGGRGGSWGGGRGWRHWYYATGQPYWARTMSYPTEPDVQELDTLKQEAAWLKEQLDAIHKRIDSLESE